MLPLPSRSRKPKAPNLSPSSSSLDMLTLPTDLLMEILKRLPLKSLICSTCVCKSWDSLLSSPTFIFARFSYNFASTNKRGPKKHLFKETIDVLSPGCRTNFYLVNPKISKNLRYINCPVGKNHFIVCSGGGLFCLFDFYSPNSQTAPLVLWNPSIRKSVIVSAPVDGVVDHTSGGFPKLIFGSGFDTRSNSYKVVRVAYFNGDGLGVGTKFRADVYDVGVMGWRSLDVAFVSHNFSTIRWRGVCLNGVIHWVCKLDGCVDDNSWIHRSLLTFMLGSEEFGEIMLPKEVREPLNQAVRAVIVPMARSSNEMLGVVQCADSVLSLWVMEEYGVEESWVKLFKVEFQMMTWNDMNVVVLSDEVVAAQKSNGVWFSYNDKTKEMKPLTDKISGRDYGDCYVGSLLLLGQKDGVLPGEELHQDVRKRKRCRCRNG